MKYVVKKNENGQDITVRMLQLNLLTMMKEIDRICKKNNIDYFLAGGSCLGAIRHAGFIPWDDDMDIAMSREEYQKFIKALEKDLDDKYIFQCYEKNKKYPVYWPAMKIRIKNTYIRETNKFLPNPCEDSDGIFIDVFIYDHMSNKRILDFPLRFINVLLMIILVFFENLGINLIPLKEWYRFNARLYGRLCKKSLYFADDITWTFNPFNPFKYEYSDIYPTRLQKFEDIVLPIPGKPHEYLRKNYGSEYMTLPPKEKRCAKHVLDINLDSATPDSRSLYIKKKRYQWKLRLVFILNILAFILMNDISFVLCGLGFVCIGISIFQYINED